MFVKHKKLAFTLVELLTVLAIITMLVALLIPALAVVRNMAKETQQKVQLTTIEMGLTAFRNDYGDYPPSAERDDKGVRYCGAQKLAEALFGQDLLGFHPSSLFRNDGTDKDNEELYPDDLNPSNPDDEKNLKARRGPYLELATANAFKLEDLFDDTTPLASDTFVLCDVFGVKRITLAEGKNVKAGTPILYYKANTSSKTMEGFPLGDRIYNCRDNLSLIQLGVLPDADPGDKHKLEDNAGLYFYDEEYKIIDPKVKIKWPYRPDSYILISAGADGLYGTSDDICNF